MTWLSPGQFSRTSSITGCPRSVGVDLSANLPYCVASRIRQAGRSLPRVRECLYGVTPWDIQCFAFHRMCGSVLRTPGAIAPDTHASRDSLTALRPRIDDTKTFRCAGAGRHHAGK